MLKNFDQFVNENEQAPDERGLSYVKRLYDLGLIDRTELVRAIKKHEPEGWATDLFNELEEMHKKYPESWGMPVRKKSPYDTIELDLDASTIDMPYKHYSDWAYKLVDDEPIKAVIYLEGDGRLELRATYAYSDDYDYDDDEESDEDQYDATWWYTGPQHIFSLDDLMSIILSFNEEVNEETIGESDNWYHD